MRIITISRQFGSGGRELGRKMADILGWDYYDNDIIQRISDEEGVDPAYIHKMLHDNSAHSLPFSFCNSFSDMSFNVDTKAALLNKQKQVLECIAEEGRDCIIVGREADIILRKYKPFKLYVCADLQSRIDRCMKRELAKTGKQLTEEQVKKNIKKIDKNRALERGMLDGSEWGSTIANNLTVNASEWNDMDKLARAAADFALKWFED